VTVTSISGAERRNGGRSFVATMVALVLCGLFGLVIGYFASARPLYRLHQAQSWAPASCVVVASRVEEGMDTSSADITYRYTFGDRQYTSNFYNFVGGQTSDPSASAVVAAHPPGKRVRCYVDPGDPRRAVINRSHTREHHLGTAFFAMFTGIPFFAGLRMVYGRRRQRRAEEAPIGAANRAAGGARFAHAPAAGDGAPVVLKPATAPRRRVVVAGLVCLFWNGGMAWFAVVEYWLYTSGESVLWFIGPVFLIFQVVGVVIFVGLVREILALSNPRPTLTLSRASVPLGGSVSFAWELTGAAHRVTRLQMTLTGKEEARYSRGTDLVTDTHVFHTEALVDASHASGIGRGAGTIRIPRETMHTFIADNNKVVWTLAVNGTVHRWPDLDETFDITVTPA
jgi:hypothetical protein